MTFTQLNTKLKNFLRGWLLVLGLKECVVECATLCVKSEVILLSMYTYFVNSRVAATGGLVRGVLSPRNFWGFEKTNR